MITSHGLVLTFLATLLIFHFQCSQAHPVKDDGTLLLIAKRLNRTLEYFDTRIDMVPIDASFCLNAMESFLSLHTLSVYSSDTQRRTVPTHILQMAQHAGRLTKQDVKVQVKKHPKYYSAFGSLINHSFKAWPKHNSVEQHLHQRSRSLSRVNRDRRSYMNNGKVRCKFNEKISDSCLREALHCKRSPRCVNSVFRLPSSIDEVEHGYCLTHQIIYYESLRRSCMNVKEESSLKDIAHRRQIQREATKAVKNLTYFLWLDTLTTEADAFSDEWLERYVVGTMVGAYEQFVREPVLRYVMGLQTREACWKGRTMDRLPSNMWTTNAEIASEDEDETMTMIDYGSNDECDGFHTTGLAVYYLSAALFESLSSK